MDPEYEEMRLLSLDDRRARWGGDEAVELAEVREMRDRDDDVVDKDVEEV